MRAVLCKEIADPAVLSVEDGVPTPPLSGGSVRVAVHAAGVNFADTLVITGRYQEKPPLPFSPGLELAGTVIEIASGVTAVRPGDRVMGVSGFGAFAEEAVLPADAVFRIPDSMDF